MSDKQAVLMVVTSVDRMEQGEDTGIWLEEFAVPYSEFINQGFDVTVASIKGGKAPIDPRSKPSEEQQEAWSQAIQALETTVSLNLIDHAMFDGVFLPGGHGTMFDLPGNFQLQSILCGFVEQDKGIAAVCHGPAGLVDVRLSDGRAMVAGKTLTSFTNEEESAAGLTEKMPFLLESRLKALGANFVGESNWSDHVQVDGKLVTGQNPQSTHRTALALIDILSKN